MELLEMLDTVFDWLKTYSHTDPDFPAIKEGLKAHKLDDGEIDDCLKKLNKDGYLYFMNNKKEKIISDVVGMEYTRNLNYLITFDGKLFLKTVGGYQKQKELDDLKKQELIDDSAVRKRNDHRLVIGTFLAGLAATGLITWEMYKTFWVEHLDFVSTHFGWTHYFFGLISGILLLLTIQLIRLTKNKSNRK